MKVNDRYCSFYYELDEDYGDIVIDGIKTIYLRYVWPSKKNSLGWLKRESISV